MWWDVFVILKHVTVLNTFSEWPVSYQSISVNKCLDINVFSFMQIRNWDFLFTTGTVHIFSFTILGVEGLVGVVPTGRHCHLTYLRWLNNYVLTSMMEYYNHHHWNMIAHTSKWKNHPVIVNDWMIHYVFDEWKQQYVLFVMDHFNRRLMRLSVFLQYQNTRFKELWIQLLSICFIHLSPWIFILLS